MKQKLTAVPLFITKRIQQEFEFTRFERNKCEMSTRESSLRGYVDNIRVCYWSVLHTSLHLYDIYGITVFTVLR